MSATEAKDLYQSHFARFEKELQNGQSWTLDVRREAISRFSELGFPSTRHEEWKYTNVSPIGEIPFEPAEYRANGLTSETVARLGTGELAGHRLVFINGHYSERLSCLRLPGEIQAGSLASVVRSNPGWVEPYLAQYASYRDQAFVALNTALMRDGSFLYVPKGKVIEEPIYLVFLSTAQGKAFVSYPRNLIVVDNESQATIVESYVGVEDEVYFTNAVTEVIVGENSVVNHYKLQRESERAFHVATLQAHQDRSSGLSSHSVALGGSLVRNDINTVLDGDGSECTLNGLFVVGGKQHVDHHTRVDHVKPHCTSRELYKGILDGKARGVFNGKIFVHKAARETDAKQTNKNLLLSEDASIDTKPQLEIYNNDVKCTHGSTIGQLDPNAIFYLRSRGLGLKAARSLMTYAFASEAISQIRVEQIRTWLERTFLTRF